MVGVPAAECVVVGDIASDVEAGLAAGAAAVLVPTERTLASEIRDSPNVAVDLSAAVDAILSGRFRR